MKHVLSLALLSALSLWAGCAIFTIENAHKSPKMYALCYERVEADSRLVENFGIVRIFSSRNRELLLRVHMDVELKKRERMTLNAKMEWYDESGTLVETVGGGWQQYVFEPHDPLSFVFIAPTEDISDFRIKLMHPETTLLNETH